MLNKIICRTVYHLPIIHGILRKRSGDRYFTKRHISILLCTFELVDDSETLPSIWEFHHRLPTELKPDIVQEVMGKIASAARGERCVHR